MSAFWGRAYPSSEESVMDNINDIIAAIEEPPETFEEYLTRYAAQVGTLVNSYIPQGSHPDMDRYLYEPLNAYSQNGGKRHRPLICFAACRAVGGDMARATSAAMMTSPTRPSCAAASPACTSPRAWGWPSTWATLRYRW